MRVCVCAWDNWWENGEITITRNLSDLDRLNKYRFRRRISSVSVILFSADEINFECTVFFRSVIFNFKSIPIFRMYYDFLDTRFNLRQYFPRLRFNIVLTTRSYILRETGNIDLISSKCIRTRVAKIFLKLGYRTRMGGDELNRETELEITDVSIDIGSGIRPSLIE